MSIIILADKNSIASNNIKDKLINHYELFVKTDMIFDDEVVYQYEDAYLITTKERSVYCECIDKRINDELSLSVDLLIFATTHTSKSGIPSFSAHAIGNWGNAELGGIDTTLCISAEPFIKEAIIYLEKHHDKYQAIKDFDVIQEVTHHGPITNVPTMFIEIGSSEKEWHIQEAGMMIAETIIYLIDQYQEILEKPYKSAFGIGGTHTCSNFHKIIVNDPSIDIGHVCPKYMLKYLTKESISEAMKKTIGNCKEIIIDWKGLGTEKNRIIELLENMHINYKKTKEFKYET